tara:strand:- start:69 stop:218 length:150 start_codon:yes stop_codon:yes gene_type:complete
MHNSLLVRMRVFLATHWYDEAELLRVEPAPPKDTRAGNTFVNKSVGLLS